MNRISMTALTVAAVLLCTSAQAQKSKTDPLAYTDQKVAEEAAIRASADGVLSQAQIALRADVDALQQSSGGGTPAAAYVVDTNGVPVGPVVPVHTKPVYTVENDYDRYRVAALLRAGEDRVKVLFNYATGGDYTRGSYALANALTARSPFRVYYTNYTCSGDVAYVRWYGSDYDLAPGGAGDIEFDGYSAAFLVPTDKAGQSFAIARLVDEPAIEIWEPPAYRTTDGECRPNFLLDRTGKEYVRVSLAAPATAFKGPFRIR